ncbi:hypothetical protein Enr10x_28690 [Gimesia panareensis]|uniref:Uncharacterized protein n=1 Tax=Gimesia panareensis TaxID=2527978 RepID=A0A517Q7J6_9PLAN|nr:hypothetical protein [Gimesia panareensis]QDT27551.1 hypothetical protein Enr10x_28690 [Gimesia panareensis]
MMRIRCFGDSAKELSTTDKLVDLMRRIENGEVERPEIEVVGGEGQVEKIIHIGALFREGSGECVGWLVSTRENASRRNYAYCVNSETPMPQYLNVLFCGSPEAVDQSAVLRVDQVADLVPKLIDGNSTQSYSRKRLTEIMA